MMKLWELTERMEVLQSSVRLVMMAPCNYDTNKVRSGR